MQVGYADGVRGFLDQAKTIGFNLKKVGLKKNAFVRDVQAAQASYRTRRSSETTSGEAAPSTSRVFLRPNTHVINLETALPKCHYFFYGTYDYCHYAYYLLIAASHDCNYACYFLLEGVQGWLQRLEEGQLESFEGGV